MTTHEMTPRQRTLAVVEGRTPDRVPTDYWATAEFTDKLYAHLGVADREAMCRKLHIDALNNLSPKSLRQPDPDGSIVNNFGVGTRVVNYATGAYTEYVVNPLAGAQSPDDVHAFDWPTTDDFDYTDITDALRGDDRYRAVCAGSFEPFLIYCAMRGMELAFEDLLINPDIADAIFGRLFDFYHEHNRRIFEAGIIDGEQRIDVFYLAEDLGGQTGPLFSLDVFHRFFMPNMIKMADFVRSYGVHIYYHTDGAAWIFLDDLVNTVGIEVLNPIQWRCPGMERERLVETYGKQIAFHGSIDNQHTLPFGTVDEVVTEVKQSLDIYQDARWICAPCHNIQAVSPVENVVAMYETIHAFGRL
jgi:uroporphyrinogen decarboxylase